MGVNFPAARAARANLAGLGSRADKSAALTARTSTVRGLTITASKGVKMGSGALHVTTSVTRTAYKIDVILIQVRVMFNWVLVVRIESTNNNIMRFKIP